MSRATEQFADVQHNGTPYVRTALTTANGEMVVTPAEWANSFVEFTALDCNLFVRFGTTSGIQVDGTTASTSTAGALTSNGTKEPHLVVASGTSRRVRVKSTWTHLAFICSNATGKVYMCLATGTGT